MTTIPENLFDEGFGVENIFNTPRQTVFDAFTQCKHLKQWWHTNTWTLTTCELDFRVGGSWVYCMRDPDGIENWAKSVYQEITVPERIVRTDYFTDKHGVILADMPQTLTTLSFESISSKQTKLTYLALFDNPQHLKLAIDMDAEQVMKQTFDDFAHYLVTI